MWVESVIFNPSPHSSRDRNGTNGWTSHASYTTKVGQWSETCIEFGKEVLSRYYIKTSEYILINVVGVAIINWLMTGCG